MIRTSYFLLLVAFSLVSCSGNSTGNATPETKSSDGVFSLKVDKILTADLYVTVSGWIYASGLSYNTSEAPSDKNAMYCFESMTLTNLSSKTVAINISSNTTVFDGNSSNGREVYPYRYYVADPFPASLAAGASVSFRRAYWCFRDFQSLTITLSNGSTWSGGESMSITMPASSISHQDVYYYPEKAVSSVSSL
jgi:hypothetical protein